MSYLFYVTSIFLFVVLIANALYYIELFEDKAFSVKRLFLHFTQTKQGRKILFGKTSILKWLSIFSYAFTIFYSGIDGYYDLIIAILYASLFLFFVKNLVTREFPIPKFSIRTGIILVLALFTEYFLFSFAPVDKFLWMAIIDKLLPIIIVFFFILSSIFFDFKRDEAINNAVRKISNRPNLLSIVVVGSYGRGSTKEFIARILANRYNVLSANSSFENAITIAAAINSGLSAKKQIFIAEIDDYKRHDIEQICEIIIPKIVVVTGVNEQKLSLFGNMDNIVKSKFEAISSLSKDGIALFNGSSVYTQKMFDMAKSKKFKYVLNGPRGDVAATNIREQKFSVSFDISFLNKTYKLSNVKLLGLQNIENLLPAIFIGIYAGIDFSEIRHEVEKMRPLKSSMQPRKIENGAILIDDTHNANINSVLRALSYMNIYKGRKVLVFEPLVELGKMAGTTHVMLGREIGKICDCVFLTNDNYQKAILKGVRESGTKCEILVAKPSKIINFVKKETRREDVVVFEGHETSPILAAIPSKAIY